MLFYGERAKFPAGRCKKEDARIDIATRPGPAILAEGRRRRTQAERSAQTQSRLIEAAIRCLHDNGYADTTTAVIAKEAGVSPGAMQHQFPTKASMMGAVAEYLVDSIVAAHRESLDGITEPDLRLKEMLETGWRIVARPHFPVLIQISLAARSDPDLAAAVNPILTWHDRRMARWIRLQVRRRGSFDAKRVEALRRATNCVLRGFAVERVLGGDPETFLAVETLLRHATNDLLAEA